MPEDIPCGEIEAVICNGLFLYTPPEKFPLLKTIQLTSAGLDRVPADYMEAHGIKIFSARGVYSAPMAEFAVCSVLGFYKRTAFFAAAQAERRWEKHRGLEELGGKRVVIVGCGSVGRECADRFRAALDVFEQEPLPADSELWALPNAVITPHNSFVGEGNRERLFALITENLR